VSLVIGLVHDIRENPYFGAECKGPHDVVSDLLKPNEVNRIVCTLKELGHEVEIIDGPKDLLKRIDSIREEVDLIFNKSRGIRDLERKIFVPAICKLYGLPFVGSSGYNMTLALHKYHTNRFLKGLGFRVPEAHIFHPGENIFIGDLHYPVIVKPNNESSSLGITENSIFYADKGIKEAILKLQEDFDEPVVVEEYISGEEWKVAVVGNRPYSEAVGVVGAMRSGSTIDNSVQTREDIFYDRIEYYKPRDLGLMKKTLNSAKQIHDALECNDYSRCDFRLGRNKELVFMEVATHPDVSECSSFVTATLQRFGDYTNLIDFLLRTSCQRQGLSY